MPVWDVGRLFRNRQNEQKHTGDADGGADRPYRKPRHTRFQSSLRYQLLAAIGRHRQAEDREERAEHRAYERSLRKSTNRIAGLTAVLAAVGFGSAIFSGLQWLAIRGQLDEMRGANGDTHKLAEAAVKQGVAAERQALALRGNMRFDGFSVQAASTPDGKTPIGWIINPTWTNSGPTDARDYVAWWGFGPVMRRPNTTANEQLSFKCPTIAPPQYMPQGIVVPQGGRQAQEGKVLTIDEATKAFGDNAVEYLYAIGHAQYNDIFDGSKPHLIDWCIIVFPNSLDKGQFSFMNVYIKAN